MLIILNKNIYPEVDYLCKYAPLSRFRCLTNLLQAHADGKHIAVIHPSICRMLEDSQRFSEEHRAIAKKIRNKYSELAQLPNILQMHASLCTEGTLPTLTDGVWNIPIDWLANYGLSESTLICEDLYDCDICQEAANDFLSLQGLNGLRLKLDPTPGGGGNTHRVLESKAITGQKISVCVVDSDRESPHEKLKSDSTAEKCMQITAHGVYQVIVSTGREIENHIPSRLLDNINRTWEGDKPSNSYIRLNKAHPDITLFNDMKSGVKKWNIDLMNENSKNYWQSAYQALGINPKCCENSCQSKNSGDCCTSILHPFGKSLLKSSGQYLKSQASNPKRHTDYLPSPNDSFWKSMGAVVAAYCIAPKTANLI